MPVISYKTMLLLEWSKFFFTYYLFAFIQPSAVSCIILGSRSNIRGMYRQMHPNLGRNASKWFTLQGRKWLLKILLPCLLLVILAAYRWLASWDPWFDLLASFLLFFSARRACFSSSVSPWNKQELEMLSFLSQIRSTAADIFFGSKVFASFMSESIW